jgi:hypothetical protein
MGTFIVTSVELEDLWVVIQQYLRVRAREIWYFSSYGFRIGYVILYCEESSQVTDQNKFILRYRICTYTMFDN